MPVVMIDKRPHVGGNSHDQVHETGTRFHTYGPHLFHTSNRDVVSWITRFGEFVPYRHSVTVKMKRQQYVPIPINILTLNAVFKQSLATKEQATQFLDSLSSPQAVEANASDYLNARLGKTLTDLFFRPYTRKMWACDLEDLDASVVRRIPIRVDSNSAYFPDDTFQGLPKKGYNRLFENILDDDLITVCCNTAFHKGMLKRHHFVFNSMPIDEFYDSRYGPLPYRSIRFHQRVVSNRTYCGPTAVINFSDNRKYTRQTDWSKLPGHKAFETGHRLLTLEEPCCYTENNFERYYPDRALDKVNARNLLAYNELANNEASIKFIGRCGTYQYLDMHQVINQSLQGAAKWLARYKMPCDLRQDVPRGRLRFSASRLAS